MGRGWLLSAPILGVALLASCAKPMTRAQEIAEEDRAVAQVEATERALPPPRPVKLQRLPTALVFRHAGGRGEPVGAGCAFVAGDANLALTLDTRAEIVIDDEPLVFTSDAGATRLPGGAWTHYVGKALALALAQDGQVARLVVMDPYNRPVFTASGLMQCPPA